ncbi:expressed protein [Chlorella variabilis]|uniref:Expressed protein n=1 Tax=Chlorella variabilis TaxID=554065 RepID=E1ZRP0_CHLVA|nr:expressed protein [Chlorella variabilis]EFN51445.1 expressed protein [Chlorella variabilis]|eukprot:XP_005843547.1 expressed protein [Chlorella variabilis]
MSSNPASDEQYEKVWEQVEAMPPEQQKQLRAQALDQLLRRRRVMVDGKVTSLRRLQRRVEEQRRLYESGAFDETVRTLPRWQLQDMVPSEQLRQGAYKMQLRQREEAELELDRIGHGNVFSPRPVLSKLLGGRRDFGWGIYARTANAEQLLAGDWAGRDPQEAASDGRLYLDVVRNCHNLELTLVALTSRPLPLAPMRQQLAAKLKRSMQSLAGSQELQPQHKADLHDFISMFDDTRVAPAGWMDKSGCVKEGTHFMFSTTPEAHLLVEAITPGRLRDRRTSRIGVNRSPLVTGAIFDMFLGEEPLDDYGKKDVGHGMLWAANGFRFRPWEMRPGQYIAEEGPDGQITFPQPEAMESVGLPLRPSVFQMLDEQTKPLRRMLLGGIRRARRQMELVPAGASA